MMDTVSSSFTTSEDFCHRPLPVLVASNEAVAVREVTEDKNQIAAAC